MQYKKGKKDVAANSLLWIDGVELMALMVSSIQADLWQEIIASWDANHALKALIASPAQTPQKHFTWINAQLRRKWKLVVGDGEFLRKKIITSWHFTPSGGHSGIDATTRKVMTYFY